MFQTTKALYFLPLMAALTMGQSCSYFAPKHDDRKPTGPGLGQPHTEQTQPISVAPIATQPVSDSEIPMYGGKVQSFKASKAPYNIAKAQEMSREAIKLGWNALLQHKDARTAMARFNQAWVSDPDNFEVYWGFGLACSATAFQKGKNTPAQLTEAAQMLEKALSMAPKDTRIMLDLANTYNKLGYYHQSLDADSKEANAALIKGETYARRACINEPQNGRAHFLFAANLFYQKKYQDSWSQLRTAQALQYQVPVKFIADLNAKMKDQQ